MKKNEDIVKNYEVSTLDRMEEKMYVVKVGNAYIVRIPREYIIELSKHFDEARRFKTYNSASKVANVFGGEVLRVGAYSLMFIDTEGNKI